MPRAHIAVNAHSNGRNKQITAARWSSAFKTVGLALSAFLLAQTALLAAPYFSCLAVRVINFVLAMVPLE